MANESNLSYMGYLAMQQPKFDTGDIVVHRDYGIGTVKKHPDAPGDDYPNDPRNDIHVYFHNQDTTTIWRVRDHNLREATVEEMEELQS